MNPLASARELCGLSQSELASRIEVSPQTIQRIEKGTLRPSHKILKFIVSELSPNSYQLVDLPGFGPARLSVNGLLNAWEDWRTSVRSLNGGPLRRTPVGVIKLGYRPKTHPLTIWRVRAVGPKLYTFCNLLAIHPYSVERFERGTSPNFPGDLYEALLDAGLDENAVNSLMDACRAFAAYHNDGTPIPARWR